MDLKWKCIIENEKIQKIIKLDKLGKTNQILIQEVRSNDKDYVQ